VGPPQRTAQSAGVDDGVQAMPVDQDGAGLVFGTFNVCGNSSAGGCKGDMESAGGPSKCRTLPPVPAVHTRTVVLTTGNDGSRESTVAMGRPRKEEPHRGS